MLAAASALLAINLWTGAPLLALWVGARAVGQQSLSMTAVLVVIAVLVALMLAIALALAWLDSIYRRIARAPLRDSRSS